MISVPAATPSRSYEVTSEAACQPVPENARQDAETAACLSHSPPVRRRWAKVLLKSLSAWESKSASLEMPDGERRNG
jgi:hypothetical protein